MNIMHQRQEIHKKTSTVLPKKLHMLYELGFWTLSCERVYSVRGNIRQVIEDAKRVKKKAYRLLANKRLRIFLPKIVPLLGIVKKHSIIAVDFSHFGKWQVLMFAVQTRNGRALPVYFEIIEYPIEKDSQNIFIINAIEQFVALIGFRPKLVFDRGFACPSIITHLAQNKHRFIIRIKGGKHVSTNGTQFQQARSCNRNDANVIAYGLKLRLVISHNPNNGNEPWYLITNDMRSSQQTIIDQYYYRFEIEEFFKDAKWLQGLEHLRFKKIESITTLLWFVLIGWWCFSLIAPSLPDFPLKHSHDRVSITRLLFESMQRQKNLLALSAIGVHL